MTLDQIRALATAATPGPWKIIYKAPYYHYQVGSDTTRICGTFDALESDADPDHRKSNSEYIAALSPEVVLAMLDCIAAADAYRDAPDTAAENATCIAYDDARSRLTPEPPK